MSPLEASNVSDQKMIADFCDHLSFEKQRSRHTVRAYESDLNQLLETVKGELDSPTFCFQSIELQHLRGWLAGLLTPGLARSSVARKVEIGRAHV